MWEKKPILFLVLATAAILAGSIVTMVAPFAGINTAADKIASVTPYGPLELAGRDIYIREGCNNCHTQTVRPLVSEVIRYGDYSRAGEFLYDRPHLWGSRRTGPDLARIGGKYPDAWHYQHMENPTGMVPQSNMPAYAFLKKSVIDPILTRKKMTVLGFPYSDTQINALQGKTEMDALVAYLQKLGSGVPWRARQQTEIAGEINNPFVASVPEILAAGKKLYIENCSACHGIPGGKGTEIASALDVQERKDKELFLILLNGISDAGMPSARQLGQEKIWKILAYLRQGG